MWLKRASLKDTGHKLVPCWPNLACNVLEKKKYPHLNTRFYMKIWVHITYTTNVCIKEEQGLSSRPQLPYLFIYVICQLLWVFKFSSPTPYLTCILWLGPIFWILTMMLPPRPNDSFYPPTSVSSILCDALAIWVVPSQSVLPAYPIPSDLALTFLKIIHPSIHTYIHMYKLGYF